MSAHLAALQFAQLGGARRTIETPGGPLAALDVPAAEGGRGVALLVPGYTGSKEDFALVLGTIAESGHRAVAIDMRGQYESPGPDDTEPYTIASLARDELDVIDALDAGPVHLIGHSFGGLVCRAAVLERPAAVRSLTLMSSGPAGLTGPRVLLLDAMRPVLADGGMEAVYAAMEALAAADPAAAAAPEWLRDFLRARFFASSATGLRVMGDEIVAEPDRVDELRATGVPTFVVYGVHDDAWSPEIQAEMASRLGAPHVVVPHARHSPAAEAPEPTARALLDFWRRVERAE